MAATATSPPLQAAQTVVERRSGEVGEVVSKVLEVTAEAAGVAWAPCQAGEAAVSEAVVPEAAGWEVIQEVGCLAAAVL